MIESFISSSHLSARTIVWLGAKQLCQHHSPKWISCINCFLLVVGAEYKIVLLEFDTRVKRTGTAQIRQKYLLASRPFWNDWIRICPWFYIVIWQPKRCWSEENWHKFVPECCRCCVVLLLGRCEHEAIPCRAHFLSRRFFVASLTYLCWKQVQMLLALKSCSFRNLFMLKEKNHKQFTTSRLKICCSRVPSDWTGKS